MTLKLAAKPNSTSFSEFVKAKVTKPIAVVKLVKNMAVPIF